jgi:tetratricopeptide (TPR) repeat protein
LVFLPSLRNGFINWDDQVYVLNNSSIKALTAANLRKIFTSYYVSNYQPLTLLSFLVNYQIGHLEPFGYHLTNFVLHALNGLLVFWLVRLLRGRDAFAFFVALLFSIHPLRAESVAWVAERKDVLYAFFYLGALVSYVYYLQRQFKARYLWIALALFLLSLLSKSMAVTLPVMLFCFDYYLRRRPDLHMFLEKIPFFVLSAFFALIALYSVYGGSHDIVGLAASEKFRNGPLFTLAFYLGRIFWPAGLSAYYPADVFYATAYRISSYLWPLAFFSIFVLSVRRSRAVVFGCLFFIVSLLPLLQFLPMGDTKVADRFVYMASIGMFFILAEWFFWLWDRAHGWRAGLRVVLVVLFTAVVLFCALTTHRRCRVWENSVTFWTDILKKYPQVVIAYNNRGLAFINEGSYGKAFRDSTQMSRIIDERYTLYKGYYQLYNANLAILYYLSEGQYHKAIEVTRAAIKADPDKRYKYQINLAVAYASLGDAARAEALLRESISRDPETRAEGYYNLALMAINRKALPEAEGFLRQSLQENPDFGLAHEALATIFYKQGNLDEAIVHYKRAVAAGVQDVEVYNGLVVALMDKEAYAAAWPYARLAVQKNPRDIGALSNLGSVLCALGRPQEAISVLERARTLAPSSGLVHNNLCFAYYLNGDCRRAEAHCRQARIRDYPVPDLLWQKLDSCRPRS